MGEVSGRRRLVVARASALRRPEPLPPLAGPALSRRLLLLVGTALVTGGCGLGAAHHVAAPVSPSPMTSSTSSTSGSASASPGTSFQPTAADFRAVRNVLARRASAVREHDEQAFLRTVDRSNRALVTMQRTLFANLSALSIASLRYAMDPSAVLVPSHVTGHDPVLRPQITEFLRIGGAMDHPVTNGVDETFVRRGGHWVLGAEVLQGGTASYDAPQWRPWAGPPIAARRAGPMTVIVDRTRAATLPELVSAVQDDIRFDAGILGVPASEQLIVDATSSGTASSFSSTSKEEAAAVTFPLREGTLDDDTALRARAGLAIKVNPHQVARVVGDPGVMRHELTHYLLHAYNGVLPEWLTEGVATWVQYYPDAFSSLQVSPGYYAQLMKADRALPSIGLFNQHPDVNYPISQAAVTWLVARGGVSRLKDLMNAYRSRYRDVNVDALTPRLLRQVYGVTEQEVVAGAFAGLSQLHH